MTEVISVRFKDKGKIYFFDPAGLTVQTGASVIVETAKGQEFAECAVGNHHVSDTALIPPLRPVLRVATTDDIKREHDNKLREKDAFVFCQKKIEDHGLEMKLVDVEYSFDGSKILFFFTSDGRVDFRELVKDLAAAFRTRIELRQIGVRDEAKMLGGLGICGKPFCCSQFLDEFHPVSIKMAKTQGLSLNPTKISGTCGRLMCCLKYEQVAYEDLVKKAPKNDAFVDTPSGKGSIVNINLLRGTAKVRLEDVNDATLKTFPFDELEVLGGKARRAEYIAAKAEGRLEEAGFKESVIKKDPVHIVSSLEPEPPRPQEHQQKSQQRREYVKPQQHKEPQQRSQPPKRDSKQDEHAPHEQQKKSNKKQQRNRPPRQQAPKNAGPQHYTDKPEPVSDKPKKSSSYNHRPRYRNKRSGSKGNQAQGNKFAPKDGN